MGLLDADPVTDAPSIAIGRLVWAGPLTVFTSLAAVHLVRQIVIGLPPVQADSAALRIVPVTVDTTLLCTTAVFVYLLVAAFHDDAIRRFRWIAVGALLVSFLPLVNSPGIGNGPTLIGVGALHVAAYVPCVTLLPWATSSKSPPAG